MDLKVFIQIVSSIVRTPFAGFAALKQANFTWQQLLFYINIPLVFLSAWVATINFEMFGQFPVTPTQLLFTLLGGTLLAMITASYIMKSLAPRFGAPQTDFNSAYSLMTFSYLPVFAISLIAAWHPALQILSIFALAYMVFLFFTGTKFLITGIPEKNITGFVIITLILLFLARVVFSSFFAAIFMIVSGNLPEVMPAEPSEWQ